MKGILQLCLFVEQQLLLPGRAACGLKQEWWGHDVNGLSERDLIQNFRIRGGHF